MVPRVDRGPDAPITRRDEVFLVKGLVILLLVGAVVGIVVSLL